ncbi:hypothetical protein J437_LFUL018917 [Ladona fulva]|uniref:Pigment dispersing factor n=1 Tax=Ladona fulva TaxID=123851 RepID=A0A8K0P9N8_LADFU|nr:hypothetical protein J437_LFUL018917 [Ladona fulva]
MKNLASVILVLYLLRMPFALCMDSEDEKYLDKEYAREIASWLTQLAARGAEHPIPAHKRNSELINSLLGLPKVMNDAGKK